MNIETLEGLKNRIDGLIQSIDNENLEEEDLRFFIEHKYMSFSMHACIERKKLKELISTAELQLKHQKQLQVYRDIETLLSGKLNLHSTDKLYSHLKQCQSIVNESVKQHNT